MAKKTNDVSVKGWRNGMVAAPSKAIPVTLLSGFLVSHFTATLRADADFKQGSGKTTLLQHILRSEHGLRIAVIVNDIGAVNVDASLIKRSHTLTRTEEKVVALQNGCICCTLRGDLLEELVRLAEVEEFDYIIIESSGISEPEQVAETFDVRLAEQMGNVGDQVEGLDEAMLHLLTRLKDVGGLEKFARLDTTTTVIDAFTMFHDFETTDLLSSRRNDVVPEDERTVSDLMVDQIEFADVIILNKIEMIDRETKHRLLELVKKLNHRAKVLEASFGKIDVAQIVNTGMFSLERARTGYGWLEDLHAMTLRDVNGRKAITPKPETEEYNVRNFVYSRRRPFHPRRLYELLHDKFILQLQHDDEDDDDDDDDEDEDEDDDEDEDENDASYKTGENDEMDEDSKSEATSLSSVDNDDLDNAKSDKDMMDELLTPDNATILKNKRDSKLFGKLFRSKGEFFLATRPHRAGDWSQAGAMLTLQGGRPWFCTLPPSEYLTGSAEIDELVRHDISAGGEWGDRHQEIVFIGEALDTVALETALDRCLLTDAEMGTWKTIMRRKKTLEKLLGALLNAFEDAFPDWPDDAEEGYGDHEGHNHGPGGHGKRHLITNEGTMY